MQRIIPLVLALMLICAPLALAQNQTMTVVNSTTGTAVSTTFELSPAVTTATTKSVAANGGSIDTGLPANASTLNSLELKQNNLDVAGTPILVTGVAKATLMSSCNQAIPPCLALTPASNINPNGVKEANLFLISRSLNKQFCLTGTVSVVNGSQFFALANGLVVKLVGATQPVGPGCLCGVRARSTDSAKTIEFQIQKACDATAAAAPKK